MKLQAELPMQGQPRKTAAKIGPMRDPQLRWYAVQTHARAEKKAQHHLTMQGYAVFAPVIRRKVRHARQVAITAAPLFPGYIFVALNVCRDRWRSINGTVGVSSLIMVGDVPLPLPEGLIEALALTQDDEHVMGFGDDFQVDKPVLLRRGPFSDLIGRILHIDARGRVQVLLEIMGRAVPVSTTLANLSPVRD
jgi:transcriptional antiterminator RfaH